MAERQQQASGGFSAPLLEGGSPVPFMSVARSADDVRRVLESRGLADIGPIRVLDSAREARTVSDFYGGRTASSLSSAPPIVVELSEEAMARLMRSGGIGSGGGFYSFIPGAMYLPGTNIIVTTPSLEASPSAREDVLLHEINHYASFLGRGGYTFTFEHPPGTGYHHYSSWLEEGMTEFFTSRMLGGRSMAIEYPYETVTIAFMEMMAGPQAVRDAFTGTGRGYDGLREALDARLGEGTFFTLMGMQPTPEGRTIANGGEAFEYLLSRAQDRGIGITGIVDDPIYRMAFPPPGASTGASGPQSNR